MSTTRRIVPREDGGGGIGTALRRWGPSYFTEIHADNLGAVLPDATETVKGVAELATASEVNTGTDTQRIVTPAGLHQRNATETLTGLVELATTGEALAGTDTQRAVTPAGAGAVRTAHEAAFAHADIALNTAARHDPVTGGFGISVIGQEVGVLPVGALDWPVTLAYTSGDLTSAIYAKGTERYRQTLSYDAGNLDTVVYAYSDDSGSTYTDIGTETLVYTSGDLTSTTWTPA